MQRDNKKVNTVNWEYSSWKLVFLPAKRDSEGAPRCKLNLLQLDQCSIRTQSRSTFTGFYCVTTGFLQLLIFSRACLCSFVYFLKLVSLCTAAAAALYSSTSGFDAAVVRHLFATFRSGRRWWTVKVGKKKLQHSNIVMFNTTT